MNQERHSALALLKIKSERTSKIDFEGMVILFTDLRSRRKF